MVCVWWFVTCFVLVTVGSLALLLNKSHLDVDKGGVDTCVVGKGHAAIGVHGRRSEELHIIVLAQNPLAHGTSRLGKGLDVGS